MRVEVLNGFFAFDGRVLNVLVIKTKMNNDSALQNKSPAHTKGSFVLAHQAYLETFPALTVVQPTPTSQSRRL